MLRKLLIGALLLAGSWLSGTAEAKTITAASCSEAHVRAAINDPTFVNGDTIAVPAGLCTWSSSFESTGGLFGPPYDTTLYNKYFTWQGAGATPSTMDRAAALAACGVPGQTQYTCIVDGVSKAPFPNVPNLIRWDVINSGVSRITGFTFIGGTGSGPSGNIGILQFRGSLGTEQIRFDHNSVYPYNTTGPHFISVLGVVDHNYVDISQPGWAWYRFHLAWAGVGGAYGDNSWNTPSTLGTANALYFEYNTIENRKTVFGASGPWHRYCLDGWGGYRAVDRHETYINCSWADHGTESSGRIRGARQNEVYDNDFIWNMDGNSFPGFIGTRGGTGVFYDNRLALTNGVLTGSGIDVETQRASGSYPFFGACDNTNPWDLNNANALLRRCIDQVGNGSGNDLLVGDSPTPRWTNQVQEPLYVWNNRVNGVVVGVTPRQAILTEGTDYIVGVPKPGYTPFTDPHPLAGGGGPDTTPPSAPTGFRVR